MPPTRAWLHVPLLALAYLATGRIGLMLDPVGGFATLVWPPTGIALAALLRGGLRLWPGVMAGAFAVNAWTGAPLVAALGMAAGNTLEVVVAVAVLARVSFDPRLERVRDAALLMVIAAALSTTVSATIGTTMLRYTGVVPADQNVRAWLAWWLGDATGVLLVAPPLLTWFRPRPAAPARSALEAAFLGVALTLAALTVFGASLLPNAGPSFVYVLFAPLGWAAARFGPRGAAASMAWVACIAVAGTASGRGLLAGEVLHASLFELQSLLAGVAIVVLLLAAAFHERDVARRAALVAVQARDDFLSIASHELRTPLTAIVLSLGLIELKLSKQGGHDQALARAARQANRMTRLINNLLDVTRIDSGKLWLQPEPIDLGELLRELIERLHDEAERAGCRITLAADGQLHGAWDRTHIERVITNLVGNAFQHAAGAPIEVRASGDDTMVRLEVEDQGDGIDEGRLGQLFDRFTSSSRPERGGLGLGLYITRHLVAAHGGSVTVRSAPGSGTTFIVELPRRTAEG